MVFMKSRRIASISKRMAMPIKSNLRMASSKAPVNICLHRAQPEALGHARKDRAEEPASPGPEGVLREISAAQEDFHRLRTVHSTINELRSPGSAALEGIHRGDSRRGQTLYRGTVCMGA